jgi:hypothetical protein
LHLGWIITWVIVLILIGLYVWAIIYARKRQKAWDAQYQALKERHEVFVLNKKIVKERPKTGLLKRIPIKTYQVVGRISVSQAVRGMQMSKMQTVTFHTNKQQFEKIQPNHKYKMDIAGNYIGLVIAPPASSKTSGKGAKAEEKSRRWFWKRDKRDKQAKSSKS